MQPRAKTEVAYHLLWLLYSLHAELWSLHTTHCTLNLTFISMTAFIRQKYAKNCLFQLYFFQSLGVKLSRKRTKPRIVHWSVQLYNDQDCFCEETYDWTKVLMMISKNSSLKHTSNFSLLSWSSYRSPKLAYATRSWSWQPVKTLFQCVKNTIFRPEYKYEYIWANIFWQIRI